MELFKQLIAELKVNIKHKLIYKSSKTLSDNSFSLSYICNYINTIMENDLQLKQFIENLILRTLKSDSLFGVIKFETYCY